MAERIRRKPRQETRAGLLEAAARVFARRGFHGASVEAVAEDAGFSTGAVYSNFDGKEALFLALYEERLGRRRRELTDAVVGAGGRADGLAAAAADVSEALRKEADWFLLYFEFALHAARNPRFRRRFAALREEGLAELVRGLEDGLEDAGIDPAVPAEEMARAIRALTYGLALDRLVEGERGQDRVFGRFLELLFRGLAGGSPRARRRGAQSKSHRGGRG